MKDRWCLPTSFHTHHILFSFPNWKMFPGLPARTSFVNGSSCESSNSPILLTVFLSAVHGRLSDYSNSSVNIINTFSVFSLESSLLARPFWIHISHSPSLLPAVTRILQTGFQESSTLEGEKGRNWDSRTLHWNYRKREENREEETNVQNLPGTVFIFFTYVLLYYLTVNPQASVLSLILPIRLAGRCYYQCRRGHCGLSRYHSQAESKCLNTHNHYVHSNVGVVLCETSHQFGFKSKYHRHYKTLKKSI